MSVLKGKELRIVGFLCNWCSYGGADTAGTARLGQPTDLRIIRVPCSGRVNPLFVMKALLNGADGVLVSGCHPRDCHYSEGNYHARRRLENLKEFLPIIGIDPRRFQYTWVSASEGQRWRDVVQNFTASIHKLGPAPRWDEVVPTREVPTVQPEPLRTLGCGKHPALPELQAQIKDALANEGVELVLGWQQGFNPLHTSLLVMRKPEDVDKLVWGPLNVQNLATFLPEYKGHKIGLVVKGCDSRAVVELLQEGLINRDEVVIFGMGCNGTVNVRNVEATIGENRAITGVTGKGGKLIVTSTGLDGSTETVLPMTEICQEKCRTCKMPNAAFYDHFAGNPTVLPDGASELEKTEGAMALLESMTLEQRLGFWKGHMERCIRCYACRNACPMCVCRDHCVADARNPHWLTQEDTSSQKFFFQIIHALHLSGRCVGCMECNRACPVGIPVGILKIQINRIARKLFEYEAGMDAAAVPPLLGFELEEKNIHEHHIEGA